MDFAKRLRGVLRVVGRGVFPGVRLLPRLVVARQLRAARGPRGVVNQEGCETLVFSLRGGWVAHSVLEHTLGLALARRGQRVRLGPAGVDRLTDERAGFRVFPAALVEVGGDAGAKVVGLANVNDVAFGVLVEVHAGRSGQAADFLGEIHCTKDYDRA